MKNPINKIGIKILMSLTISVCSLLGCVEDDSIAPGMGRIKFEVSTTSGIMKNVSGRILAPNTLTFTSGKIVIREVVFDGDTGGQSISRTIEQIATIDYSTGKVTPSIFVQVPAGEYTSVNLGVELQDEDNKPSVVIEGTFVNSENKSIPVRFEFNSGEVFEADAARVTIKEGEDIVGKITFDAIAWFSVVSASELEDATLTNGVIVISENKNSDIFDKVADRLDVATQAVFQ
jgi:hypothetical protein|uniref:hypothetical protein n=1 Tax=Algoriphagus sp. TaxID=1872435 RepID=UPI00258EC7FB|nr:hypothetical protein [Algoriphagus sp.]